MESTITTKGQVTLPKAMRDALHLKTGDKIVFERQADGGYLVRPKTLEAHALKGLVAHKGEPVSLKAMEEAIRRNASDKPS